MAADSVLKAVENLIAGLTAASFPSSTIPPVWFDEAPQQGTTGTQQHPPYIILEDGGGEPGWDYETNAVSRGKFTLTVYDRSLGTCDSIMKAVLWNGQNPNLRQGLAFATLDVNPPLYAMAGAVTPTRDQHSYAGYLDYEGKRVHRYSQDFEYEVMIRGTG